MEHQSNYVPTTGFTRWMDSRLPVIRMAYDTILEFPTPRNLNYMWTFGGILAFCLGVQIVTGIVLAMHYAADTTIAFNSIEHLMRDVNYGWLMRYTHAVGASMFFIAVYLHIFRGLYYGSYKAPREVLWIIGVLIFLAMIATAFMGYSLVWGQMSFWAVTVITNLFSSLDSVISGLGTTLVQWIWGGFSVNDATLNRLFSLHYLLPFVIAGLVGLHIWALHVPGNNNPTGVELRDPSAGSGAVPSLLHRQGSVRDDGVRAGVRLFHLLSAELSRPCRQLYRGQSAADAAAYRAGMVFPAVLRDSARHSIQAGRRDRDVRRDRGAVHRAVARYVERPLDPLPPALSLVLLAAGPHLPGARLSRLQAAGGRLS